MPPQNSEGNDEIVLQHGFLPYTSLKAPDNATRDQVSAEFHRNTRTGRRHSLRRRRIMMVYRSLTDNWRSLVSERTERRVKRRHLV